MPFKFGWRIPVLVATHHGIFPNKGMFNTLDGKKNPDYSNLEGLEEQRVGFVGISHLRLPSERPGICEIDLDASFMQRFRAEELFIDLRLCTTRPNSPGGLSFDPSVMNNPPRTGRTISPPTSPSKRNENAHLGFFERERQQIFADRKRLRKLGNIEGNQRLSQAPDGSASAHN